MKRLLAFRGLAHDTQRILAAIQFSRLVLVANSNNGIHLVKRCADMRFRKRFSAAIQAFSNFSGGKRYRRLAQGLQDQTFYSGHDLSLAQALYQFQPCENQTAPVPVFIEG
jgi:hypothetical protein